MRQQQFISSMNNQQQIVFTSLLLNQNQHMKSNKSRLNSRYSLSFDQDVIQLHQALIDQELQMQFSEISYAMRISKSSLGEGGKIKSNVTPENHLFQLPSNTIQIEVQEEKHQNNVVNLSISQIPRIRLSLYPKKSFEQQSITVMIILTSTNEIDQMKIYLQGGKQSQGVPCSKSSGFFKNTYIFISLITVCFSEMQNLVIKYNQVAKNFIVFKSRMKKQINLSSTIIHQNVGLIFPQIQQQNPDRQLINYCIIIAQEHLSYKVRELHSKNQKAISQFFYIFSKHFEPNQQFIISVFKQYKPSDTNLYASQFFLYFLYMIYRENAINKIYQLDLLGKIEIYRRCRQILGTKYYQYFNNGNCFKEFLLYVHFLHTSFYKNNDFQLMQSIAKYNILNQNQLQSKRVLLKLLQIDERLLRICNAFQINDVLIKNKELSFKEYFYIKLKGLRVIVKQHNNPQLDSLNSILLQFLGSLILKMKENSPSKEDDFKQNSQIILQIFKNKDKIIIKDQYISQFLAKVKFVYRCSAQVGQVFLDCLKTLIFDKIPLLLQEQYERIIHPLLLKPQSPIQNKILLDFFQNKQVNTYHIVYLMEIWLEKKIDLYNFLTIQYVILKFMAVNRNFKNMDLYRIMQMVNQYLKKQQISQSHVKNIQIFCERMKREMGYHENKGKFELWLDNLTIKIKQN